MSAVPDHRSPSRVYPPLGPLSCLQPLLSLSSLSLPRNPTHSIQGIWWSSQRRLVNVGNTRGPGFRRSLCESPCDRIKRKCAALRYISSPRFSPATSRNALVLLETPSQRLGTVVVVIGGTWPRSLWARSFRNLSEGRSSLA